MPRTPPFLLRLTPGGLLVAGLVGAQLAFDQTWSRLLAGILVALAVLYGAPPGRPRVAWRPRVRRRRKRRGHRHSYYVS